MGEIAFLSGLFLAITASLKQKSMKRILKIGWLGVFLIVVIAGCTAVRVTRTSTNQITDLSGRWNDTDSRLVAEKMLKEITHAPWLAQFQQTHRTKEQSLLLDKNDDEQVVLYREQRPVLIVGTVLNKSHEHIEADVFIKDLERSLIQEGEVRIVTNSIFREKLRNERVGQTSFVSPETQKQLGRELGADYMLFGTIHTIVDTEGDNKVVYYQVNLELADLETNELVWVGGKKIKKYRGKGKKVKRKYRGTAPQS